MAKVEFRNRKPLFGWAFMAAWLIASVILTWRFGREAGSPQMPVWWFVLLAAMCWAYGIHGSIRFFAIPSVSLAIDGSRAVLRESFPWKTREERFRLDAAAPPVIEEGKDGEGDPYFFCRIVTPAGRVVTVAESGNRSDVEAAQAKLLAAIGTTPRADRGGSRAR